MRGSIGRGHVVRGRVTVFVAIELVAMLTVVVIVIICLAWGRLVVALV
jgi:hypothetical protein